MNPNTNHLMAFEAYNSIPDGYDLLPENLNRAARRKLGGKSEAYVSFTSGGALSRHAAAMRKKKRKAASESRKANR